LNERLEQLVGRILKGQVLKVHVLEVQVPKVQVQNKLLAKANPNPGCPSFGINPSFPSVGINWRLGGVPRLVWGTCETTSLAEK